MSDLVKSSQASLIAFTRDQVDLIKKQIAPKASTDELALFLYVAQKTGLDPLSRQIHCVHRSTRDPATGKYVDKMTIQTGIDGFRVIAQRTGDYAGQSEPEFVYELNTTTGENELVCVKVRVYKWNPHKKGESYQAAVGVAFWDEYVVLTDEYKDGQKTGEKVPNTMWGKMPHNQLSKVAEALALRKAFPQDLSGIYINEEMQQADVTVKGADEEITIKETMEELDATYTLWLDQYRELVGENEANPYKVENWKGDVTKKKYVYAIESIKRRVEEVKKQRGIK